ncbi:hypothetical protein AV530_005003 [Patagioenas fasciata monilis]|uniref:Uncharacterized protein n=1 Tax=Patagioenas fasciata monilis TaxID=372326 RepID=A0A1V4K3M7_PATFA|nr:hypothetical protein AV530_005003 [Patagioenas fasciata monilis]
MATEVRFFNQQVRHIALPWGFCLSFCQQNTCMWMQTPMVLLCGTAMRALVPGKALCHPPAGLCFCFEAWRG